MLTGGAAAFLSTRTIALNSAILVLLHTPKALSYLAMLIPPSLNYFFFKKKRKTDNFLSKIKNKNIHGGKQSIIRAPMKSVALSLKEKRFTGGSKPLQDAIGNVSSLPSECLRSEQRIVL